MLRENNYPSSFINKCERSLSKPPAHLPTNGFVVLPYVQGISEKIGRILRQQEIKVAYKPVGGLDPSDVDIIMGCRKETRGIKSVEFACMSRVFSIM